jgi:hypothetical protein
VTRVIRSHASSQSHVVVPTAAPTPNTIYVPRLGLASSLPVASLRLAPSLLTLGRPRPRIVSPPRHRHGFARCLLIQRLAR